VWVHARHSQPLRLVREALVQPGWRCAATNTQVSAGTAIMLAVGRFAFLPMHRRDLERSVTAAGPKTTGEGVRAHARVRTRRWGGACSTTAT
jgi:hypothetical protein